MDEMRKGLDNSLQGPEAEAVMEKIAVQLTEWDLKMPSTPPMMFDFGLGEFDSIGETEFWIANETEAGYCGKFMFLFAGQRCPEHRHRVKHETFFIQKGEILMSYAGKERTMKPGDRLTVEPLGYHSFLAKKNALILEVSKPGIIADNEFSDPRLGYRLT